VARDVRDGPRRRDGADTGALVLALAVAIAVGVLSGCGGGDDGSAGSSPTKSATAAQGTTPGGTETTTSGAEGRRQRGRLGDARVPVEAVLTSSDPADACGRFVTKRYLRVAYGGRQGCVQAQAPGSAAKSLRSFKIVNEGTKGRIAIATAVPNGGPYDGSKLRIRLVGGSLGYQVDALRSNIPVGP
jgi:hypothetical protein